jgi:hypothetical protein
MRIVGFIARLLVLLFGFVTIAFVAVFSFIAIVLRQLFGRSPAPRPAPPGPGATHSPTRYHADDVIDVVATPVAKE